MTTPSQSVTLSSCCLLHALRPHPLQPRGRRKPAQGLRVLSAPASDLLRARWLRHRRPHLRAHARTHDMQYPHPRGMLSRYSVCSSHSHASGCCTSVWRGQHAAPKPSFLAASSMSAVRQPCCHPALIRNRRTSHAQARRRLIRRATHASPASGDADLSLVGRNELVGLVRLVKDVKHILQERHLLRLVGLT